jgi:hypothetical protein
MAGRFVTGVSVRFSRFTFGTHHLEQGMCQLFSCNLAPLLRPNRRGNGGN